MLNWEEVARVRDWERYSTYHPCPGLAFQNALRDYQNKVSLAEVEKQVKEGTYVKLVEPDLGIFELKKKGDKNEPASGIRVLNKRTDKR